jgi:hypothetical protein
VQEERAKRKRITNKMAAPLSKREMQEHLQTLVDCTHCAYNPSFIPGFILRFHLVG